MKTLAIVGSQWGDEGKGKITDLLSSKADLVVRFQGGNNAGHTIIVGDKKIVLHLIPSGVLHDHCTSVIGHGVVLDPAAFAEEFEMLKKSGINLTSNNLKISENCTIITAYHRLLDGAREGATQNKIGTTGKGIGPAYEDKIARRAIKLKDIFSKDVLREKLASNIQEKKTLFETLYKVEFPSIDEEVERLFSFGENLKQFSSDTFTFVNHAIFDNKKILFEGAQGVLLDIDYGSYPYVTSSSTSYGGIFTGCGIANNKLDGVLGITKAYTTRVGEGPFPTELFNEIGIKIQTKGNEFGSTTGRQRRCGWLDLPLLKYAVRVSNISSIALTKLDVLSNLSELKICVEYKLGDRIIDCSYPGLDLNSVEPVYKSFTPFNDNFESDQLSDDLEKFIKFIEDFLEIQVGILAYGPERREIIFRQNFL